MKKRAIVAAASTGAVAARPAAAAATGPGAATLVAERLRPERTVVATEIDGRPLGLGRLGPQWAVREPRAVPEPENKPVRRPFGLCPRGLYAIDVAPA